MEKQKMKSVTLTALAILIVGAIFFITLWLLGYGKSDNKGKVDLSVEMNSDIVSSDPMESAANFINFNGTIGDLKSLKDEDIVVRNFQSNVEMRGNAFHKVKDAVVPDSPLINGKEEEAISNDLAQFPVFYSIEDLKVGKPSDVAKLTVEHNEVGRVEYEMVKLKVDFKSVQTTFYWPTDVSSDAIITKEVASDNFEGIEITLIKSGDLWFIYDVADSEYTLNVRMSTWSGRGEYDVSNEQEVVAEYVMEDIYGLEEKGE